MDSLDLLNITPVLDGDSLDTVTAGMANTMPHLPAGGLLGVTRTSSLVPGGATDGMGRFCDPPQPQAAAQGASHAAAGVGSPVPQQGQCGSSTDLVQLGALQLPPQHQLQASLGRSSAEAEASLQGGACWPSSNSLAGVLHAHSQPGSATAATAAGGMGSRSSFSQRSPLVGSGSGTWAVEAARFGDGRSTYAHQGAACPSGLQQPAQFVADQCFAAPELRMCAGRSGVAAGSSPTYAGVAAAGSQHQGLLGARAPVFDMYSHMCQPRDMVVITHTAVPSNEQILALLAAPLPGAYGPGTAACRQQYTEVTLYTEKGQHPVAAGQLSQQLQKHRLFSSLAALTESEATSASSFQEALKNDLKAFLSQLLDAARHTMDLGRLVAVWRLDPDDAGSAALDSDVGLIIAASATSKSKAEAAVMWLLNSMEAVLQAGQ